MKKLTEKKLSKIGFKKESWLEWWNGSVFIVFDSNPENSNIDVYVSARITSGKDYARPMKGIKTKRDLIKLCKLVNGK